MRYLGEDDVTQMMGIGYLGEVRQGPDGAPLSICAGRGWAGQSYRRLLESP